MVTSLDVAREAGVSQATVSRVLNGSPRVSEATRARVLAVVERLEYTPHSVARSLVTNRTNLVGVVVSDIVNPFYPQFLQTIDRELVGRGLKMVLTNDGGHPNDAQSQVLIEQRVDGIIFTSALVHSEAPATLAAQHFPFVLANRYADGVDCDIVVGDNDAGARAAADHLLELGHRRIGVILGQRHASTSRDRLAGFAARCAEEGVELDEALVRTGNYSYPTAYAEALALFEDAHRPTAVFCANDLMALAVLNAARRRRLRVPGDVSVVGFDDIEMASWEIFELTTVRQPLAEMARTAVDMLAQRIASPRGGTRTLTFPSLLVQRKTTAPARRERSRTAAKKDKGRG